MALAIGYVVVGRLGLHFAQHQPNATLIWAPTGLSLAALLLFGRRLWPGVFVGALLVNLTVDTPLPVAMAIAVGNTLEAVVGSLLLERVGHVNPALDRARDVLGLLFWGALVSTIVSATIGVGALDLAGALGTESVTTVWLEWWLGDAGGALVVTPLVLVAVRGSPAWGQLVRRRELWVVTTALGASLFAAFSGVLPVGWRMLAAFPPFVFLVWAGLRLGPRGAVVASFVSATVAIVGTAGGTGPFVGGGEVHLLWAYNTCMAVTACLLAAVVAERDAAESARREVDEQRRELEEHLRQKQRLESLGTLAGGVAHDFNNLLGVVRGYASILQRDLDERDAHHEYVSEIDRAAVQAADLCRQLLTYAGRTEPAMARVELGTTASELATLIASSLPEGVNVTTSFPDDLPAITGDTTQVRQLLMNLVLNAGDAMAASGGTVRVSGGVVDVGEDELRATLPPSDAEPGRFVFVEVSDDGVGMDEETRRRVFDAFFTTKQHGRGLGMATVAGIVKAHRGIIHVRSRPGEGTTIRVSWPPWESDDGDVAEEEANTPPPTSSQARRRALIADDNADVVRVTERILTSLGWTVVSVS
ncbi:MAG: MASE1 domain-containing protein, partial [Polyangiaceae bacterium]